MNILVCYVMHIDAHRQRRIEGHSYVGVEAFNRECLIQVAEDIRTELIAEHKLSPSAGQLVFRSVVLLSN